MDPLIVTAIVGFFSCLFVKDTQNNRRNLCIIICLFFIMQAGLRDYTHSHNDTYNYFRSYTALIPESLSDLLSNFSLRQVSYVDRDPGFDIFVKLTQLISKDFQFFLLVVASIISIPICRIIYKYTDSMPAIVLAAMLYEALFSGFFETGIRQTIAMGIIYCSLPFVVRRKWIPHYFMLAVAWTIHSSAMIFLPFYILSGLKHIKRYILWAIILIPFFMGIAPALIMYIGEDTIFEDYTTNKVDNLGTPVFSTFLILVSMCVWVVRKRLNEADIRVRMLVVAMICSLLLMPSTWVNSNFIRLVFYYLVFLLPLIPLVIEKVCEGNKDIRNLIYMVTGLALIALRMQQ